MKKKTFLNLNCHLVGSLLTIYKHFGDYVKCIFTILLQIQHENNFLPTSKHRQGKVRIFRVTVANQNARKLLFADLVNTKN